MVFNIEKIAWQLATNSRCNVFQTMHIREIWNNRKSEWAWFRTHAILDEILNIFLLTEEPWYGG